MNSFLFFVVFSLLALFYALLGLWASKKVQSTTDYFLAGRNLGLFPVTFTLIATQLGGGMLLGTSENAYLYGLYGLLYTVGMAAGFLALGFGIAAKLQSLNVATTAAIFETRYKSITLKKIASLLSIITMCGILIGQVVGSRSILETLELGAGAEPLFIAFWVFVIAYTMVGGLHAVVVTDVAQVAVIIAIFTTIFLYAQWEGYTLTWLSPDIQRSFSTMPLTSNAIVATLVMPALFSLIEQDLAQRFFAARTRLIAGSAALCSAAFMVLFALIPIYFGMQAKLLGIPIPAGASPLIPTVAHFTNELVVVLALCAIMAAITSTADSLLCAISSNIAQDFDFSWLGTHNALRRSQYITLLVGIAAVGASYIVPQNIITILIDSYTVSVSCLLIPLLAAYFCKQVHKKAAYYSVLLGAVGLCIIPFWHTDAPKALLPLACSCAGYLIGMIS